MLYLKCYILIVAWGHHLRALYFYVFKVLVLANRNNASLYKLQEREKPDDKFRFVSSVPSGGGSPPGGGRDASGGCELAEAHGKRLLDAAGQVLHHFFHAHNLPHNNLWNGLLFRKIPDNLLRNTEYRPRVNIVIRQKNRRPLLVVPLTIKKRRAV